MNSKVVAGVVIALVITGVVGVLILDPFPMDNFHIEKQIPSGVTAFELQFVDLEDTNLSISFVDDETLLYSIDIELYEPATRGNSLVLFTETASSTFHSYSTMSRIRSLNVILGTGIPYDLGIWGTNLVSSLRYDNGALIDSLVWYEASGTMSVTLTEDVVMSSNLDFTNLGGESPSLTMSALYLDIDLQDGVGGELYIGSVPISFVERVGWTWDGFDSYDTVAGSPTAEFTVGWCDHIYANLLN